MSGHCLSRHLACVLLFDSLATTVCTMRLPFTQEQFVDLFAAYNASVWPAVLVLWLASLAVSVMLLSRRRHDRWILALLAAHWMWSALGYHVAFFARINSAAWMFAALFPAAGGLVRLGRRSTSV